MHCFESKSPNVPDMQKVAAMFKQKCEAKNIKGITTEVLLKQLEESKSFWDEQLAHQITDLKPFDDFAGKAMEVMRLMLHNR